MVNSIQGKPAYKGWLFLVAFKLEFKKTSKKQNKDITKKKKKKNPPKKKKKHDILVLILFFTMYIFHQCHISKPCTFTCIRHNYIL